MIASRRPSGADVRPKEVPTTAPRRRIESALALALVLGLLAGGPALADTKSDLDRAKQELAQLQVRLSAATAAWQAAVSRLAQTREQIAATRAEIDALRSQVERIQQRLQRRAVIAFETGPATTIDLLLSSQTFTEFSDRMEFLGNVVQNDSDLVLEREVTEEQLRRQEQRLASLGIQQADAAQQLASSRSAIAADTAAVQQTVSELEKKLKQEQQLLRVLGQTPHMGAPIAVCPVRGPNSFVDSFGWPRPGGRVHEGIDMIAPYGTPIVSVQNGTAVRAPNALGGNAVIVYGPGGDWTYYAHMSSYGAVGGVSIGTVIGYVGSTGDTNVNHLHFEYHPGGGPAVDPYRLLLAVC